MNLSTIAKNEEDKSDMNSFIFLAILAIGILILMIVSAILESNISNNYHDELAILNHQYNYTFTFFMELTTILFFSTFLIYISFLPAGAKKRKSFNPQEIDFRIVLNEIFTPTKPKYKRRRILFLIFLITSIVLLITAQIYVRVGLLFLI